MSLIRKGSRGDEVKEIQKVLGIDADGIFGSGTEAAVKAWQKANGLSADGIVGPNTKTKMFASASASSGSSSSSSSSSASTSTASKPNPGPVDKNTWPEEDKTGESLTAFFGPPATKENLVRVECPYPLYYDGQSVSKVRLHKKVADSFLRVMQAVLDHYGLEKIKELGLDVYGGSYNDRNIRGGNRKSTHAWGIALDFDPGNNKLKQDHTTARFAKPEYDKWWECWEAEGWYSLGRQKDYDWMHVQACWRE